MVPANGWFEWQKKEGKKTAFYIYHNDKPSLFIAAISKRPYGQDYGKEGVIIITSSDN
ncbi:SOS response-associated peptidase family protein [Pantoea agglomerans]|uniref:SOS response-associated peptidase family protein n=1 Tax=Enterobacter agglomerans TaxID=549 RepID=UPI003018F0E5